MKILRSGGAESRETETDRPSCPRSNPIYVSRDVGGVFRAAADPTESRVCGDVASLARARRGEREIEIRTEPAVWCSLLTSLPPPGCLAWRRRRERSRSSRCSTGVFVESRGEHDGSRSIGTERDVRDERMGWALAKNTTSHIRCAMATTKLPPLLNQLNIALSTQP